jgi:GT2 family glycosyltransferase
MLKIFKEKPKSGTVGCRLHFEDNTVQHDGVIINKIISNNRLNVSHSNIESYYLYANSVKEVLGNTAALMMIRKNLFNKIGGFNEIYKTCFEDVELNLTSKLNGFKNYYDGSLVAYHYESKTRGRSKTKFEDERDDFNQNLLPFINLNYNKLFKQ